MSDWETPCPKREDRKHCVHWYDGEPCCDCEPEAARRARRTPEEQAAEIAEQRAMNDSIFGAR